jgi:hypothetical protein
MIIFGYRARTSTLGRGTFHCPGCGTSRTYSHQKVQRWITLYFIPVLPLDELARYLHCDGCGKQWDQELRSRKAVAMSVEQVERELRRALRRAIAAVILSKPGRMDGRPPRAHDDPTAIDAGTRAYHRALGVPLAGADLVREIDELSSTGTDITRYLEGVGAYLTSGLRETVATAACEVALHDGAANPAELAAVQQVAAALGLTDAELGSVMARVQATPASR